MPETVYQGQDEIVAVQPPPQRKPDLRGRLSEPKTRFAIAAAFAGLLLLFALWYFTRPKPAPPILGAGPRSIALSENGELLAVATNDGRLRLVSIQSGHTLSRTPLPQLATAICFGPDGAVLVLAGDKLLIFAKDLSSHVDREAEPNSRDLVWSSAIGAAIIASGGADDLHPSLEFFPAQPMGLGSSTSERVPLVDWAAPVHLAASADGSLVGVTLNTNRRANVIFYSNRYHKVVGSSLVPGRPAGIALSADAQRAWVVSPDAEAVSEITAKNATRTDFPKSASTSPLRMIAVNDSAGRAYTTGAPTFPEVDLDQQKIARKFEMPTNSAAIALPQDGNTAYVTFTDANRIGVLDLRDMSTYRQIELR